MIDWDKHSRAKYANVTFFDETDKTVGLIRLARPTQKTVADAVAALSKEELTGKWEQIRYAPKQDYFFPDMNRDKWFDSVHVCTRKEFEAYVKEQEGEKWTHWCMREKCRIRHAIDGKAWVECERMKDMVVKESELYPIKPKLTKAQAWDLLMARKTNSAEVNAIKQQYDII